MRAAISYPVSLELCSISCMSNELDPQGILKHMQVPEMPGVYILGAFEQRVTLYSQQVRALNLIYALLKSGTLAADGRVAVIGGGAGGLTVAAAAAAKGCEVFLLESEKRPLHLLSNCLTRWIHPHIYDWPEDGAGKEEAGLPLMNWKAGTGDEVRRQLLEAWDRLPRRSVIEESRRIGDLNFVPQNKPPHRLSWNGDNGSENELFDAVVFAIGFGIEKSFPALETNAYWRNDPLDQTVLDGRMDREVRILVSGCGDGGLTDYLRARLANLRHADLVDMVIKSTEAKAIAGQLIEVEKKARNLPSNGEELSHYISREYKKLRCPELEKSLRGFLRDTQVVLNGSKLSPLDCGSSILNRFLASRLLWGEPPTRYLPGRIQHIEKKTQHNYLVQFECEGQITEEIFNHVVVRHGTTPALQAQKAFAKVYEKCGSLRARNALDQTRIPHWGDFYDFSPSGSRAYVSGETGMIKVALQQAREELEDLYQSRDATHEEIAAAKQRVRNARRGLRNNPSLSRGVIIGSGERHYELLSHLGDGGFATVWVARDFEKDEFVAVKILHEHRQRDDTQRTRFLEGAKRMSTLDHPNIVKVLDISVQHGPLAYYVMEYFPEGDLEKNVKTRKDPLTTDDVVQIVKQIGAALDYAHQNHHLHLDLKPSNILLRHAQQEGRWHASLADFDQGRVLDAVASTRSNVGGTYIYAAPETMYTQPKFSARSDIFSLGMTALFALSGSAPSIEYLLDPDLAIRSLPLLISDRARQALRAAISWYPRFRPQRAIAFCQELDDEVLLSAFSLGQAREYRGTSLLFPESAALRKLLFAMFPREEEFAAFIGDYFSENWNIMHLDRQALITGLLQKIETKDLIEACKRADSNAFQIHKGLLDLSRPPSRIELRRLLRQLERLGPGYIKQLQEMFPDALPKEVSPSNWEETAFRLSIKYSANEIYGALYTAPPWALDAESKKHRWTSRFSETLPYFSDFEAFCNDYYPEIARKFSRNMEGREMVRLLFFGSRQYEHLLHAQLRMEVPDAVELFEQPLKVPVPTTESLIELLRWLAGDETMLRAFCQNYYPAILLETGPEWESQARRLLQKTDYSAIQLSLRDEFPGQFAQHSERLVPVAEPKPGDLRRLIVRTLLTMQDFQAFCEQYFRSTWLRFSSGMDYQSRITILFTRANPAMILLRLEEIRSSSAKAT